MILQANPKASYEERAEEFLEAAKRSMETGWYILGEEVECFEREFAAWAGVSHGVGCANGTDAIELILRGLEAGPGKVVFTVAHTAVATVTAVERSGAVPWMVDVEEDRLTLSPGALEMAIAECRARRPDLSPWAVIPVHIYGQPADMDSLLRITRLHGLHMVEDCAQSHGALYKGIMTGTMGVAAAFSLYPTKNLGAFGDAGIILTNDVTLKDTMVALRQYGWKERYVSALSGVNSRMDPLQVSFLRIKLRHLREDNARRRTLAAMYDSLLAPLEESGGIRICRQAPETEHVYHQYVIRCRDRDGLQRYCRERGVGTAIHYPVPVHEQPAYMDRNRFPLSPEGLPHTEAASREVLSLPMYPQLKEEEVKVSAQTVLDWVGGIV